MTKTLIVLLLSFILLVCGAYATEPEIIVTDVTGQTQNAGALSGILPQDVEIRTEAGIDLLVKTFEVPPDTDPSALTEQNLERGGVEYILREITKRTLPAVTDSETVSQSVSISAPSNKQKEFLPLLPEHIKYDLDGYTGRLTLDESSITTEVESTKAYSYTVRETKEYHGLTRNDPYLVPKTLEKNGRSYNLADILWSGGSENSPSSIYTATAIYTGKATGQAPDGYIVTAQYTGEVTNETPGNVVYSVIYEPIPVPVIPDIEIPDNIDWGILTGIALFIVGGGALAALVVYLFQKLFRRVKKPVRYTLPDNEPEARPARRKPHALGYMKRDGGNENV